MSHDSPNAQHFEMSWARWAHKLWLWVNWYWFNWNVLDLSALAGQYRLQHFQNNAALLRIKMFLFFYNLWLPKINRCGRDCVEQSHILTLRKISNWMSKNCQKLDIFSTTLTMAIFWQFFDIQLAILRQKLCKISSSTL